ncbi:MAG TPA: hypothetical protein VF131_04710 [Blastocatellia bacterium]|nr:hypothetical protein [Blastocatellia bacterium]
MAVFDKKSRYVKNATTYEATDRRRRKVVALTAADKPVQTLLGEHLRKEGQRLDHLANFYIEDPNGFWRVCELNDAMLPDQLAEVDIVKIPTVL